MKRNVGTDDTKKARYLSKPEKDAHEKQLTFSLRPMIAFDKRLPYFRKPSEIGSFSVDKNRCFVNDRNSMKYYIPPKNLDNVNYDLTLGYKDMIRKDENKKDLLDNILHWILLNKSKFLLQSKVEDCLENRDLHTDFICWRGLLTKLMCTPYENRDDLLVAISKFNNTIYMCEFETEQRKRNKAEMTQRQDEMCCWGWKFEQYITADKPNGSPVPTEPVNNNEEFGVVVRSRLESHSLVFSGEVDARDTTDSCDECNYIEFKTTREIENQRQKHNFDRFKLIKWWAQSYLVGIPKIVCGYRDDDGIVHRLETMNTLEIPHQVQDLRDPWKPNVMLNFLDQLLAFIKSNVKEDNPREVYLMSWKPNQDIILQKLPSGTTEYQFLPDWYIEPDKTKNST